MSRYILPLLFWILILSACSTNLPPPDNTSPASQGCAYQWASRGLPELSSKFQERLQQIQPAAVANASAFGEECVFPDGHADFSAIETDFNVTLQINSVQDASECGEWVVKVMRVIADIPKAEIVGPRPGKVNLILQAGPEQKNLNFYIERYQLLSAGLNTTEICKKLQQGPP